MNAGSLTRRIQIERVSETPDGFGGFDQTWTPLGAPIFARRRDVSDQERVSAARFENKLVTRFVIRASSFARGIRRLDRLVHEGITYEIDGIKEWPDSRAFLEITAVTEDSL
ncbi:MAG: head-tail adaptor protein [Roseovarius sp.]